MENDLVDLVFVTHHSNFVPVVVTRQEASVIIQDWFEQRERVRKAPLWCYCLKKLFNWGRPWTMVYTYKTNNSNEWFTYWAVDGRTIISIYTRERYQSSADVLAESQKRIADMMEEGIKRAQDYVDPGDEWKNGKPPEED